MSIIRSLSLAAWVAFTLGACAQNPTSPAGAANAAPYPPGAAKGAAALADRMAMTVARRTRMREMHDSMSRAGTPPERQALMAEQMKLMQDGMGPPAARP